MIKKNYIIAIVGAPRSGKSFLAKKLAQHYGAELFLEGEEQDIPDRIIDDIKDNIRPLERILWFRNRSINTYLQALNKKEEGGIVILDTFWITNQMYIDTLLTDSFENKIMKEVGLCDRALLPTPDVILFLDIREDGIRDFVKRGSRTFDLGEDFIKNQILPVNKMHKDFFCQKEWEDLVIRIERNDIDFDDINDFKKVCLLLENRLDCDCLMQK